MNGPTCMCKEMDLEEGGITVCMSPPTEEDLLCDTCREGCHANMEVISRDSDDNIVMRKNKHVRFGYPHVEA